MNKRKLISIYIYLALAIFLIGAFIYLIFSGAIKFKADINSPATMRFDYAANSYSVGDEFDVNILMSTGGADADAATALLNFDAAKLQAVNSTLTNCNIFPVVMTNSISGSTINFSGVINLAENIPFNGSGTLATVRFRAIEAGSASLNFVFVPGSTSNTSGVSNAGVNILGSVLNTTIPIIQQSTLNINLQNLQGRANAANVSVSVSIAVPSGPETELSGTTDVNGLLSIQSQGFIVGETYNIKVKPSGYLSKTIANVVATAVTNLTYADFKNGDIDNNNQINIYDFSSLRASWGDSSNPNYNPLADLDNNNFVNIFDFSILRSNFGQNGS